MPCDIAVETDSVSCHSVSVPLSQAAKQNEAYDSRGSLMGVTERQRSKVATIKQLLPTESPEGLDSVVGCVVVAVSGIAFQFGLWLGIGQET